MSHCRREVLHEQWRMMMDDEFLMAYGHGIVIQCCDDIKRRFYPRFFTYSADYKEKFVYFSQSQTERFSEYFQDYHRLHPGLRVVPLPPLSHTFRQCTRYGESTRHEATRNPCPCG
jgi:hypothetical protein